jgi:hypothetical protein
MDVADPQAARSVCRSMRKAALSRRTGWGSTIRILAGDAMRRFASDADRYPVFRPGEGDESGPLEEALMQSHLESLLPFGPIWIKTRAAVGAQLHQSRRPAHGRSVRRGVLSATNEALRKRLALSRGRSAAGRREKRWGDIASIFVEAATREAHSPLRCDMPVPTFLYVQWTRTKSHCRPVAAFIF